MDYIAISLFQPSRTLSSHHLRWLDNFNMFSIHHINTFSEYLQSLKIRNRSISKYILLKVV